MIDRMKNGKPVVVHGDGASIWTLTHSEDFAAGFTGLLGNRAAVGHAVHITSDELLTWDRVWMEAADAAGCEARIAHVPSDFIAELNGFQRGNLLGDKAHSAIFDNAKIKHFVPGFQARIPWREGICRTLEGFHAGPGTHAYCERAERHSRSDTCRMATHRPSHPGIGLAGVLCAILHPQSLRIR